MVSGLRNSLGSVSYLCLSESDGDTFAPQPVDVKAGQYGQMSTPGFPNPFLHPKHPGLPLKCVWILKGQGRVFFHVYFTQVSIVSLICCQFFALLISLRAEQIVAKAILQIRVLTTAVYLKHKCRSSTLSLPSNLLQIFVISTESDSKKL